MFSLRIVTRSMKLSSAASAARCVSIASQVPKIAAPLLPSVAQRRAYNNGTPAADSGEPGTLYNRGPHRDAQGQPLQPTETLYVGNMQFDVKEADLKEYFSTIGEVVNAKIIYDPRGLSKGFGYVQFADIEKAKEAVEKLNNEVYQGRRLNVQYLAKPAANRMTPNEPTKTLFIGNMNFEMSDEDVQDLFKDIKNCIDVRVAMDRRTGQARGFAHADFTDVESAQAAKEKLAGRVFFGRALRVDFSASPTNRNDRRNDRQ